MDRSIRILLFIFLIFSLLPFQKYGIGDLQFIILGLFSFSTLLLSFFNNANSEIIKRSDCLWLFFIVWSFSTFFWSTNVSLVWYPSFAWFIYFALAIAIRYLSRNFNLYRLISKTFSYSFYILLVSLSLIFIFKGLPQQYDSSVLYSRNYNYLGCLLSVLFPFVVFDNSVKRSSLLLRCFIIVIYTIVLYKLTVKGAFLASIIPSLLWLGIQFRKYRRFFRLSFILSLLIIVIVTLIVSTSDVFDNLVGIGTTTRAHLLKASYNMFTENPISGVGTGNWFINIYQYPFDDINFFSNGYYWIRYYSHNLYSLILSEMGLLGFISFLMYWGNLLYKTKESFKEYAPAYISVVTYLILSCFYNACNFLPFQFNGVQFIAFICVGSLMSTLPTESNALSKWYSLPILSLLLLSICWFCYMAVTNNYYHKAISLKKHNPQKALSILEDIYQPKLFTSRKHNHVLPFEIARLQVELNNKHKANLSFMEALKYSPFDGNYHAVYGDFLSDKGSIASAKLHYLKAIEVQKNRYNVNYKLGKIYFDEAKKDSALIYLSRLRGSSYDYKSSILIKKLEEIE